MKPLMFLDLEILLCSVSAAGERLVRAVDFLSEWAEVGCDRWAEARQTQMAETTAITTSRKGRR